MALNHSPGLLSSSFAPYVGSSFPRFALIDEEGNANEEIVTHKDAGAAINRNSGKEKGGRNIYRVLMIDYHEQKVADSTKI